MAIEIVTPEGADALTEFLRFPDEVYSDRSARWPAFVPFQLGLLTGESPFAQDRRVRPFVAREDGRIVARALAVIDLPYQRHWRESLGHLNMFEARPGAQAATRPLMEAACAWLAGQGATAVRAGFGSLESPFAIEAYDLLPPSWLRQNPPYYHALLEEAGFEVERCFVDYKIAVRPELVARWERDLEAGRRAGFEIVPLKDVPEDRRSREFVAVWNDAFQSHWGQVPFRETEVAALIQVFASVGMDEVSVLAYLGTEAVGILWVVPEMSALAVLAPGRALDPSERLNNLGIGVRQPARGRGVNLAMAASAYLELARRGATHLSYTLVLDDNWPSRRTAEKLGAEVCARYVAYRRGL